MTLLTHLNTYFREVDLHGELFPGVDVRVVGLFERSLELVQLIGREGRPVTTMLLLAPVAVYVLPAACAEFLVAAAAGGVAAVLTWKPQQRERGKVSEQVSELVRSPRKRSLLVIGAVMVIDLSGVADAITPIMRA